MPARHRLHAIAPEPKSDAIYYSCGYRLKNRLLLRNSKNAMLWTRNPFHNADQLLEVWRLSYQEQSLTWPAWRCQWRRAKTQWRWKFRKKNVLWEKKPLMNLYVTRSLNIVTYPTWSRMSSSFSHLYIFVKENLYVFVKAAASKERW